MSNIRGKKHSRHGLIIMLCLALHCTGCLMPWERGIGDPCDDGLGDLDTSCAEGVCVHTSGKVGTCHPYVEDGGPCESLTQCISEGFACRPVDGTTEGQTFCLPRREEGDVCNPVPSECNSSKDLVCFRSVCTPPQRENQSCRTGPNPVSSCEEGLTCTVKPPLEIPRSPEAYFALDRNDGICLVGGNEGEQCSLRYSIGCAPGLECVDGFCQLDS